MDDKTPMTVRQRLNLLGGGLLLLGLALGFIPFVSSHGVGCGSGFIAKTDTTSTGAQIEDIKTGYGLGDSIDCDGARAPFRYVAIVLLAGGAIAVASGWVTGGRPAGAAGS